MARVVGLSKVIFKFKSKKGNQCFKIISKVLDGSTGEIIEGSSLITEKQAKQFSEDFDIPIKDLDEVDEETFEDFEGKEGKEGNEGSEE